jgi:multidrug resistance efflux pump
VPRRIALIAVLGLAVAVTAVVLWLRSDHGVLHYTGFVEGEERVLRSEVSGRVLEVAFGEGDLVPAGAVIARIDPSDVEARLASKRQEVGVLDAEIHRQEEQVDFNDQTWRHDVDARKAELAQAEAEADLAARTYRRQTGLLEGGVSSKQRIDEARSRNDQARSALRRAHELLSRAEAEAGSIELARRQLAVLQQQRELAQRQLDELEVQRAKYDVRAPGVATRVQTQLLWPGELAQPGTPLLSVLDPRDKYVQIYVPVSDLDRVRVGRRVEIELDSEPGRRVPGEVSFVADQANFTPEKIETRSDRIGQVYRAKVRILDGVERFQPGTEGNVYLMDDGAALAETRGAPERGS